MSTLLNIGDLLEFRAYCADDEQASVNTYHFKVTSVNNPGSTDEDAADFFSAFVAATYKNLAYNGASYKGMTCQIINRIPLPIPGSSTDGAGVGTGGATGLPRQTAGLISWRTNGAGPGGRGRTYWPFISTAFNTAQGIPDNTLITSFVGFASAMIALTNMSTLSSDIDVAFVLRSRKHGTTIPITFALAPAKFATQKRRGSFGRPNTTPFG